MSYGNTKETQNKDYEKLHLHVVKFKSHGQIFQIVVDPDAVLAYKASKKKDLDELRNVLKSDHIFIDPFKGLKAAEGDLKNVFETTDNFAIAQRIIDEGEIQLTHEYREKLRKDKTDKIIAIIHRYAVDPKSNTPHPITRLEHALVEAKVRIDDNLSAEDQVSAVVKALQPILPLKFAIAELQLHVPAAVAPKIYGSIKGMSKITKEDWQNDGSWIGIVEIPAGLHLEFVDMLENKTHGGVTVKLLREK
jgi:ribosome maturation protein SDO1